MKAESLQAPSAAPRVEDERPKRQKRSFNPACATATLQSNMHEACASPAEATDIRNNKFGEVPSSNGKDPPLESPQEAKKMRQKPPPEVSNGGKHEIRPGARLPDGTQSTGSSSSKPHTVQTQHRIRKAEAGEPVPQVQKEARRYNTRNKGVVKKEC